MDRRGGVDVVALYELGLDTTKGLLVASEPAQRVPPKVVRPLTVRIGVFGAALRFPVFTA